MGMYVDLDMIESAKEKFQLEEKQLEKAINKCILYYNESEDEQEMAKLQELADSLYNKKEEAGKMIEELNGKIENFKTAERKNAELARSLAASIKLNNNISTKTSVTPKSTTRMTEQQKSAFIIQYLGKGVASTSVSDSLYYYKDSNNRIVLPYSKVYVADINNNTNLTFVETPKFSRMAQTAREKYNLNGIEEVRTIISLMFNNSIEEKLVYATAIESLVNAYTGKEQEFEKAFGFPMYTNGNLNAEQIYMDLYVKANQDTILKNENGKNVINLQNVKVDQYGSAELKNAFGTNKVYRTLEQSLKSVNSSSITNENTVKASKADENIDGESLLQKLLEIINKITNNK